MKRIITICTALISALCTFAISYPKTSYEIRDGYLVKWTGPETEIDFTADAYLLDNVEEIKEYAFEGNQNLKSLILSSSIEYINIYAFKDCTNLEKVACDKKGNGAKMIIDTGAFEGCTSLKSVTFSPYLKKVWDSFEDCPALQNFYMDSGHPDMKASGGIIFSKDMSVLYLFPSGRTGHYDLNENVVEISTFAFAYTSLSSIYLSNKLERIGNDAFSPARQLTTISFPNSLRSIGERAFAGCRSLKTLILPSSLEKIEMIAFYGCTSLPEKIKIPASLSEIDGSAFVNCPTVKQFEVASGNPYFSTIDGVLFNAWKTELVMWPWGREETSYVIPEGTISIGEDAFNRANICDVTFPSTLQVIKEEAFYRSAIKAVVIPEGTQTIDNAFPYCDSLRRIELPSTLTSLHKYTFRPWKSEEPRTVICHAEIPIGDWYSVRTVDTLYVPEESIDLYRIAPGWRDFGTIKAIPQPQYYAVTYAEPDNGLLIVANDGVEIESGMEVKENSVLTITAFPLSGYELENLTVNGEPVENECSLTVIGPIHIVATFKRIINNYVVTIDEPTNGSLVVTMDGTKIESGASVAENSALMISAVPDTDYELDGLWVNGNYVNNYSTVPVTGPIHIEATFRPVAKTYVVTFDAPENGSIVVTIDGRQLASGASVAENSLLEIFAQPDSDYELETLSINGELIANNTTVTVMGPIHISATFKPIVAEKTYTITFDEPENGILIVAIDGEEIESGAQVRENSLLTILAIPYTDYELKSLLVNGKSVGNNASMYVTESVNVIANFVPIGSVGINTAQFKELRGILYNLAGQRVNHPVKGLYIQNGKKLLLRK